MRKLSISNIGWEPEEDDLIYEIMQKHGFTGLEIAPTRIFPEDPYNKYIEAKSWSEKVKRKYGFVIPSMQSIWYGRQERIFGTIEERKILIDYTKKAIDFAVAIGCKNLVFGCPRNRRLPESSDSQIAVDFFGELGDYAAKKGTIIGMEANPPIYNTNYINDTVAALDLIDQVASVGFKLNLDVGTLIQNNEDVTDLIGKIHLVSHVHISEPGLKPIKERNLHIELNRILETEDYRGFVSIEMGRPENISVLEDKMDYIRSVFG